MPEAAATTRTSDKQQRPPAAQDGPVVVFDGVTIGFEGRTVLDSICFTVEPGEQRVIFGPAGTGKSVLLKLVNGLLRPDSGSIKVFGESIEHMRERDLFKLRARIGMVFQESALFDSLTVEDNVAYRLHEDDVDPAETHTRAIEALKFSALENAEAKFPSELSGGMRRRASIARAIVTGPDLILYDSPTGGLDPITSTTIVELIVKQRDVSHTTSLLITHRLQDAFTLATHHYNGAENRMDPIPKSEHGGIDPSTKFLILNEGKVVFDGTTEALVTSTDPWLKQYLA